MANGYELKATITLKDNFTRKMNNAARALADFNHAAKGAMTSAKGFSQTANTMFSKNSAARSMVASTKTMGTQIDKSTNSLGAFQKTQQKGIKEGIRLDNAQAKNYQRIQADKIKMTTRNQLAMDTFRQKSAIKNEMAERRASERANILNMRAVQQRTKFEASQNAIAQRSQSTQQSKAGKRIGEAIYGTDALYGRYARGVVPTVMQGVGTGAAVAGTAAVGATAAASAVGIKGAFSLGDNMATIKAVTTGDEYKQWDKGLGADVKSYIQKKAINSIFDENEIAQTYIEASRAGRKHKNLLGGEMDAMMDSAAATGADPVTTAKLISTTQPVFPDTSVTKIADLVSGVSNATTFNPDDLQHMMQMASIATKNVGYGFEDTLMLGGALNKTGIVSGEMAGTLMRTAIPDLNPNTKPAENMFKKYGLYDENGRSKFYNEKGDLRKPEELSKIVADAFKGKTNMEKDEAFQAIAGDRGKMLLAALNDLGQNNNAKYNEFVTDATGKTAKESATDRNNSPQARLRNLENAFTTSATEMFYGAINSMGPVFDRATAYVVKFLPQITQFGKDFGAGVTDYFEQLFNTDAWQKAETPGEKIKVFVENITSEVGNAFSGWFNSGGKEQIASGMVSGLSTLGEVAMDVGGTLVSTAWDLLVESMKQGYKENKGLTIGLGLFGLLAAGGLVAVGLANLVLFVGDIKRVLTGFPTIPKLGKGGKGGLGSGLGGGCCCNGGSTGGGVVDKDGKTTSKTTPKKTTKAPGIIPLATKTVVRTSPFTAPLILKGSESEAVNNFEKTKVSQEKRKAALTEEHYFPKTGINLANPADLFRSNEERHTISLVKGYKAAKSDGNTAKVNETVAEIVKITKFAEERGMTDLIETLNKQYTKNDNLYKDVQKVDPTIKTTPIPNNIQEMLKSLTTTNTVSAGFDPSLHVAKAQENQVKVNEGILSYTNKVSELYSNQATNLATSLETVAVPDASTSTIGASFSAGISTAVTGMMAVLNGQMSSFVANFGIQAASAAASVVGPAAGIDLSGVGAAAQSRDTRVGSLARSAAITAISSFPMPVFSFAFGGALSALVSRVAGAARSAASAAIGGASPAPKSRSGGEYRVPADGIRLVHRDETILPRGEARAYRNGSGGSGGGAIISGNTFHVREEADVQKVARQIARELLQG